MILDDPQFWSDLTYFYGFYRRNLMPDEGAIVRQAHRGMRLMQLLDNAIGECEAVCSGPNDGDARRWPSPEQELPISPSF